MRSRVQSALTLLVAVALFVATALQAEDRSGAIHVIRGRSGVDSRGSTTIKAPARSVNNPPVHRNATQRAELTRADSNIAAPEPDGSAKQGEGLAGTAGSASSLGVPLPPGMPRGLIDNYDNAVPNEGAPVPSNNTSAHEAPATTPRSKSPNAVVPSTATIVAGSARTGDGGRLSSQVTELEPISVQLPPLGLKDEIAQWLRQLAVVMIGLLVMLPALLLVLKRLVLPGVVIRVELAGSGIAVTTAASASPTVAAAAAPATVLPAPVPPAPVAVDTAPLRRGAAADLSGSGLPVELLSSAWANEQQNEEQRREAQEAELLKCLFETNRDLQSQRTALAGSTGEPSEAGMRHIA